ncbi:hypothetical protein FB567DRAFT_568580 [Paraphoma chrysanthemicola]|uniref:Uncharacterized protein n=1 Tax=Paraphoma chrysanthemicola TaxID=798071 RepID=A0A8K0W0W9_9PLEO|nr:hypothetical protein FB567DRAFT_568580 [Paraphoma chrysanthemicola]
MSDDAETPAQPRTSRFKEHTNTTNSIHPPPDELWRDIGIEDMIEKFNEESKAPPTRKGPPSRRITPPAFGAPSAVGAGIFTSAAPVPPPPTTEGGAFGRFSRAFASVFTGFGSVLGKRKAGHADAERDKEKQVLEERKQAADEAYQALKLAQEQGLLPTPKVFVRPALTPRSHKCVAEHIAPASAPRTPGLYRSPSKKDLQKQKKLSKRVSNLEVKLASARKELHTVLQKELPPVPPLPTFLPPTPTPDTSQATQIFTDVEVSQDTQPTQESQLTDDARTSEPAPSPKPVGKIVKKRKATTNDDETYKPIPTDSEGDISMSASEPEQRTIKRVKSTSSGKKLKRQSSRLSKRLSRSELKKEEVVRIVPDGKKVPPIPAIPNGVEGKKVRIRDDGYGGLEHEMF